VALAIASGSVPRDEKALPPQKKSVPDEVQLSTFQQHQWDEKPVEAILPNGTTSQCI
jgi:hypothetical protein